MNPWTIFWTAPFGAASNPLASDPFEPWSRGVRAFWASEFQRQQSAMAEAAARQAWQRSWQTWINLWTVLPAVLLERAAGRSAPRSY